MPDNEVNQSRPHCDATVPPLSFPRVSNVCPIVCDFAADASHTNAHVKNQMRRQQAERNPLSQHVRIDSLISPSVNASGRHTWVNGIERAHRSRPENALVSIAISAAILAAIHSETIVQLPHSADQVFITRIPVNPSGT
jgi:hypothetical protein